MARSGKTCLTLAVAAVLAVTSGGVSAAAGADDPRHPPSSQDGVWRMDGYGTVLSIRDGNLRQYQTTSVSCLEGFTAQRSGSDGRTTTYASADGAEFTVRIEDRHRQRARLRSASSPGYADLRRVGSLPAACGRPGPKDPRAAFDVFWQTFEENYPFFAAKGVDWHAARERYRPRVRLDTSDDELFAVFRDMLDPLDDAHVGLEAGPDRYFTESRPGTEAPTFELDARVRAYIQERDLDGRPPTEYANGRISYADLPDGMGYLRINGFIAYTPAGPNHPADSAELDRTLNAVLTPERNAALKGLIIDVRVNGGGSDSLGLQLAARLTDRPYFAYAKRARNDPHDPSRFTRPQPITVRPTAGATSYSGPVAILTGGSTVSAGETFTQALIDRPAPTIRVGESTQGVFSDVMARALPNGWYIGLPNEEFRTRDGRTFDGPGIPPHLREPVFTEEEFAHHRDSAFDRARTALGG